MSDQKRAAKPLTADERTYIESNYHSRTDTEIATHLGRYPDTIRDFRLKNGLLRRASKRTKPKVEDPTADTDDYDPTVHDVHATIQVERLKWKKSLSKTTRYRILTDSLSAGDLSYFVEQWAEYHTQFREMTPSEEDTLEVLITCKLRLMANERARKMAQEYEMTLDKRFKELEGRFIDPVLPPSEKEIEEHRWLRETLANNTKTQIELNRDYKELTDRYQRLWRDMNATREQREEQAKIGGETFFKLINHFTDRDRRKEIGREIELAKMSTDKKTSEMLTNPHRFVDGSDGMLLMDGAADLNEKTNE